MVFLIVDHSNLIWLHWCSVGSLGRKEKENGVQNVTVQSCRLSNTQNGVRIKSWGRPSTGFGRDIRFQHITMTNVKYPIIIDQNYCPHHQDCPGQVRNHTAINPFFFSYCA